MEMLKAAGSRKVVGTKQVTRALKAGTAVRAYVANEMAALANTAAQYSLALCSGAVDPDTELPKFLEALDAAGMETYLAEANAQLNAFLGE